MVKVGINGWGRISTCVMRAARLFDDIEIVGINWRNADVDYVKYILKYDTTFGRFPGELDTYEGGIIVDGKKIPVSFEEDPSKIPWKEMGAEYIIDGTGALMTAEASQPHIDAGAKKVIISAPAKDDSPTFVYGVNHEDYTKDMNIVSAASCTTNCLAPMCKVLNDNWGIDYGLMTTIHASTGKQKTIDGRSNKDWRVGRAVYNNIIPTTTGAAKAVGKVIPEVKGKLTGMAFRVPAIDVSVVDLSVQLKEPAKYEDICAAMKKASQEGPLKGVLDYTDEEVVSMDFLGCPQPSVFDAKMGIELNDKFFKIVGYYDNEFGYTCNMLRLVRHMAEVDAK